MKKVPTAKKLCRCWSETSLCFSTSATLQVCRIGILLTMDPTLHYKMKADEPMMDLVKNTETVGGRSRIQKQTCVNVDCEHRDGCAS